MIYALNALLEPAVMERLVLLLNHVLRAEPAATARLLPHAGRRLQLTLEHWPSLLPPAPRLAFVVTPAGLLEWPGGADATEADLHMRVDAANPALLAARLAAGERPRVDLQGDAALAADVHWLVENLRWDLAGDLERAFGPMLGAALARVGRWLAAGLGAAVRAGPRPGPAR